MIVYSFLDGGRGERLREHVIYALKTFSEGSRLVRFGSKLSDNFYVMLKYSIMLHDFGKVIFNQYKQTGVQRMSFEGHEIISAWFANEYLSSFVRKGLMDQDEKAMIVLSILLHHHPMNLRERAKRLEVISKKMGNAIINDETLKIFYTELNGMIEPLSINANISVIEILKETVGYGHPRGLRGDLTREYWRDIWMNGAPKQRKAFLLLTQGLVAADYNAASKIRGGGTSEFAKTISAYLKYWT
jgi:CRISPR-associated endonuclease Cas3-HD